MRLTDKQRQLVTDHLHIAEKLSMHIRSSFDLVYSRDDCYSFLVERLCHVAKRYDPSFEVPFAAYAWIRLKPALQEYLRIPERNRTAIRYRVYTSVFEDSIHSTVHNSPQWLGYEGNRVPRRDQRSTIEKLSHHDTYEGLEWWDLLRHVPNSRDRMLIYYVLALGFTFAEMGKILSVTESRVHILYSRAIYRLFNPTLTERYSD